MGLAGDARRVPPRHPAGRHHSAHRIGKQSSQHKLLSECVNCQKSIDIDGNVNLSMGYTISGWIGTVGTPTSIAEHDHVIIIYAHGKLIQEDILKEFPDGGMYASYLIGEIDVDFMDSDDKEDIVTSDRQRVKDDDPRYQELKAFIFPRPERL